MTPTPLHITPRCPLCQEPVQTAVSLPVDKPQPGWIVFCQQGAWCHMESSRDGVTRLVYLSNLIQQEITEYEQGKRKANFI